MITGDEQHYQRYRDEGFAVHDHIRTFLFRDPGALERLLVERIREQHEAIEVVTERLLARRDDPNALAEMPGLRELQNDLVSFIELRREETQRMLERQQRVWRWLYVACGVLGAAFAAALMVAAVFLRRRLLEPLHSLSHAARRVGAGEFDARVSFGGDDELAAVASSFNRMAERLQQARIEARDAERRFRGIVEGVSAVVWEGDATSLRCSYVSPQAEMMFGHPVEEWIRTDIWRTLILPEDFAKEYS